MVGCLSLHSCTHQLAHTQDLDKANYIEPGKSQVDKYGNNERNL